MAPVLLRKPEAHRIGRLPANRNRLLGQCEPDGEFVSDVLETGFREHEREQRLRYCAGLDDRLDLREQDRRLIVPTCADQVGD